MCGNPETVTHEAISAETKYETTFPESRDVNVESKQDKEEDATHGVFPVETVTSDEEQGLQAVSSVEQTIRPTRTSNPLQVEGEEDQKKYRVQSITEGIKCIYSMALLIFSVVLVMATIFTQQSSATSTMGIPDYWAFLIFWFLIFWLGMMEGGQGAVVGLQPVDKALYLASHPRAHMNTTLVHRGDNLRRFIIGRQFLVVLLLFVTNMMASANKGASVLGLPNVVTEIFLGSGLAVTLTTIIIGQLVAQINSANCMLDFIDNYFMLFTSYASLAVEASGIMHCVHLVQIFFSKFAASPADKELKRPAFQKLFFWARVFVSVALLGFSFAVILTALFHGQTTMYEGFPGGVSVIILFLLMTFVGMMEGMQISLFAVLNLPIDEVKANPWAARNYELAFKGSNLESFLIGRQICVTCCTFIVARITTVDVEAGEATIFGVNNGFQGFFNTGLLGAVVTTVVGSLVWRIIASSFPVAFLSNPLVYLTIRLCLLLEASGVCSAAWVLAAIHRRLLGFREDESYIGSLEERSIASAKSRATVALDGTITENDTGISVSSCCITASCRSP